MVPVTSKLWKFDSKCSDFLRGTFFSLPRCFSSSLLLLSAWHMLRAIIMASIIRIIIIRVLRFLLSWNRTTSHYFCQQISLNCTLASLDGIWENIEGPQNVKNIIWSTKHLKEKKNQWMLIKKKKDPTRLNFIICPFNSSLCKRQITPWWLLGSASLNSRWAACDTSSWICSPTVSRREEVISLREKGLFGLCPCFHSCPSTV